MEGVPKWSQRVTYLQQRLESASASAAVSPVVAHNDLPQNNLKRKEPDSQPETANQLKKQTALRIYTENTDRSPPIMRPDHVEFRMSVGELKTNSWLQVNDLYRIWREKWKEAHPNNKDTGGKEAHPNNKDTGMNCRFLSHVLGLLLGQTVAKNQMVNVLAHKERTIHQSAGKGLRRRKRPARVVGASRGKGLAVS